MSSHDPDELPFLHQPDAAQAWSAFLEHCMGTLERAVARVCADPEERRNVTVEVLDRIHVDWPELLRRYHAARKQAEGSFRPWLAVVARNLAIDVLRSLHGRPTPPRAVTRMSPLRQRLFQLLYRERRELVQAWELLRGTGEYAGEFADLALEAAALEDELPASARITAAGRPRTQRGFSGAEEEEGPAEPADQSAAEPDSLVSQRAAHAVLGELLSGFDGKERLLLRAFHLDGMNAKDTARLTGLTPRAVYDRAAALIERLRRGLSERGLGPDDLGALVDFDWNAGLGAGGVA